MFQPSWVTEQCLKWNKFDCCGDADLLPFKCASCQSLFILCYECETLYLDLTDLNQRRTPNLDNYLCPCCGVEFGNIFREESHRSSFAEWHTANVDHLIVIPERDSLVEMLTSSAAQLADFLSRGMLSTAKMQLTEYRNLAESLSGQFPQSSIFHRQGFEVADSNSLEDTLQWHETLPDAVQRAFALLGIADRLFPEPGH